LLSIIIKNSIKSKFSQKQNKSATECKNNIQKLTKVKIQHAKTDWVWAQMYITWFVHSAAMAMRKT